jgi:hypothetical protein
MILWPCVNPGDASNQRWLLAQRSDGYFNIKTIQYQGGYRWGLRLLVPLAGMLMI